MRSKGDPKGEAMPIDRFYLKGIYKEETTVSLEGEEFHHLRRVMRKKEGDTVQLVNGAGLLAEAKISSIEKKRALFSILQVERHQSLLPPLVLIQALPKLSHLEWIIQKGTELGVSAFYLFRAEQSEKTMVSPHQKNRLFQIAISAMKQCGRFDLPSLYLAGDLKNLSLPKGNAFFGDLRADHSLPRGASPYLLFIGPEKGFSEGEKRILREVYHAQGVRFHPHILRTETAAIAALTLAASQ